MARAARHRRDSGHRAVGRAHTVVLYHAVWPGSLCAGPCPGARGHRTGPARDPSVCRTASRRGRPPGTRLGRRRRPGAGSRPDPAHARTLPPVHSQRRAELPRGGGLFAQAPAPPAALHLSPALGPRPRPGLWRRVLYRVPGNHGPAAPAPGRWVGGLLSVAGDREEVLATRRYTAAPRPAPVSARCARRGPGPGPL